MDEINRTYKDSVFRYLFSDAKNFVELYYALTGTQLDPNSLRKFDLDSLVISDWRNDVSFVTEDRHMIILVEQQSTLCGNMPVRCLVYYANLVKRLYMTNEGKFKSTIYKSEKVSLPRPEFYILYLGTKQAPIRESLSQHFFDKKSSVMELVVKNINIDYRYVEFMKNKSKTLEGFSYMVQQQVKYVKNGIDKVEALTKAINDCREKGYLLDYLDREEFLTMADKDFTFKDYARILAEDSREQGREEGREEGIAIVVKNMFSDGTPISIISKVVRRTPEEVQKLLDMQIH